MALPIDSKKKRRGVAKRARNSDLIIGAKSIQVAG